MKQLRGVELKRFLKSTPKHNLDIVLLLENVQYAKNVAGIFRTADASKVSEILLCGISAVPPFGKDMQKASRKKELSVRWKQYDTPGKAIQYLKRKGYHITALEITDTALPINEFAKNLPTNKIALVLGNEAQGLGKATLSKVDSSVYIPMFGKGASLNVGVSCAVCLYSLILA